MVLRGDPQDVRDPSDEHRVRGAVDQSLELCSVFVLEVYR